MVSFLLLFYQNIFKKMFDNVLDGQKYRKERYKEFYFGGATLDFSKRVKP